MKLYSAARGSSYVLVHENGQQRELDPRLDLRNHSPRFAWGYGGSGPAQLALALLADATGNDERALDLYQDFKRYYVAGLPQNYGFQISDHEVRAIADEIERRCGPTSLGAAALRVVDQVRARMEEAADTRPAESTAEEENRCC